MKAIKLLYGGRKRHNELLLSFKSLWTVFIPPEPLEGPQCGQWAPSPMNHLSSAYNPWFLNSPDEIPWITTGTL